METIWNNTMSLQRDSYKSEKEYRDAYRAACKHYGWKVRVVGGWKFFQFATDYNIWKAAK